MKKIFLSLLLIIPFTSIAKPPNVLIFLIDDLGYSDVGIYGSKFYETPQIDKLGSEGMRFTDAYLGSSVCSPTRASILTGRHPVRYNITNWIPGTSYFGIKRLKTKIPNSKLPENEYTIAEAFKDAGYKTALFGKWHLGEEGNAPKKHGFEVSVDGIPLGGKPKTYYGPFPWDDKSKKADYLTDHLTEKTIKFLKNNKDIPTFTLLSFFSVHFPLEGKKEYVKYFKEKKKLDIPKGGNFIKDGRGKTRTRQNHPVYAAMVKSMDENVGRVLNSLKELGLEENTIVIFTSDNGGFSTYRNFLHLFFPPPTSNLPLRAGKGFLYEGGIRTPFIVKWPGKIAPGSVSTDPVISMDILPTLIEMTEIPFDKKVKLDGVSMTPTLYQNGKIKRDLLYWHFPHYHIHGANPQSAIRWKNYKLIYFYESERAELYDLAKDIGEQSDLSNSLPQIKTKLLKMLKGQSKTLGSFIPKY
jgi:arylsulfatase A-like enzyme